MTRSATTFGTVGTARAMIALAAVEVLLQQQRGERQHVADVVEPVPGVVRRELGGGVVVDADQVADRVAILDPVEPADRDAAGVGVFGSIPSAPYLIQSSSSRRSSADGCGLSAGGMMPDRTFLSTPHQSFWSSPRLSPVEVHPALLDPVAVAGETAIFEDRPDLFLEPSIGPDRSRGSQHRERQHDAQPQACPRGGLQEERTRGALQARFPSSCDETVTRGVESLRDYSVSAPARVLKNSPGVVERGAGTECKENRVRPERATNRDPRTITYRNINCGLPESDSLGETLILLT